MTATDATQPAKKVSAFPALVVLITVPALVLLCIGGLIYNAVTGDSESGAGANTACKDYVRDRLKHPASADFSGLQLAGKESRWTLTGTVDADNSFGAPVRMNFSCTVTGSGDSWTLVSLTGLND